MKLKDIAQATGLSVATVSKALKGSHEISKATTDFVLETAEKMGYKAKKAVKPSKKTIGLILPEVRSNYYAELMHALNLEITNRGYSMITHMKRDFSEDLQPYIHKCMEHEVDGLLVCSEDRLSVNELQLLENNGIPCLIMTENDFPFPFDSIYIRSEIGMSQAIEHLQRLGHEKIGFLGEEKSFVRYEAFRSVMEHNGLAIRPDWVKIGTERFELGGYLRAKELLQEKQLPTAVLACYDQLAFGALRAFREHGVRIPEDISIIGFDNTVMDDYTAIPMDSITNPVEQMGITAVKILLGAIHSSGPHVVQNVALQNRLVVRKSSCPPKTE